jgi:hypothetical protein
MAPFKYCPYCSTPVHLYARLCLHCMREIDTAEHVQQLRRARRRLLALTAVTTFAAIAFFGAAIAFLALPSPAPSTQQQAVVDTSSARTAPEPVVEVPPPVAPKQAKERTRLKITTEPSADHERRRRRY